MSNLFLNLSHKLNYLIQTDKHIKSADILFDLIIYLTESIRSNFGVSEE
jgi:hypothetical protein